MPGRKGDKLEKEFTFTENGYNDLYIQRKKYDTDIGPLIREETMTGTEWVTKWVKIQPSFLWALRH